MKKPLDLKRKSFHVPYDPTIDALIPPPTVLKNIPFLKVLQIGQQIQKKIAKINSMSASLGDIESKKVRTFLRIHNERALKEIIKSRAFKGTVAKFQNTEIYHRDLGNTPIKVHIPSHLVQRWLIKTLETYKTSIHAYWSMALFTKTGAVKSVWLSDTEDRECFYRHFFRHFEKKRSSGAPCLSATLFKPGQRIKNKDGIDYIVEPFKNSVRWRKADQSIKSSRKKAPR